MMRRAWRLAVLSAITRLGTPGAWRGGPALEAASAPPGVDASPTITVQTFQFKPSALEIRAGTKVTWINQDEITHTITSGTPANRSGRFDSALEGRGATFSTILDRPGVYTYFCNRHQSIRGEIRVR
jgi:plastocyanin